MNHEATCHISIKSGLPLSMGNLTNPATRGNFLIRFRKRRVLVMLVVTCIQLFCFVFI
jgi:hypothetical protein